MSTGHISRIPPPSRTHLRPSTSSSAMDVRSPCHPPQLSAARGVVSGICGRGASSLGAGACSAGAGTAGAPGWHLQDRGWKPRGMAETAGRDCFILFLFCCCRRRWQGLIWLARPRRPIVGRSAPCGFLSERRNSSESELLRFALKSVGFKQSDCQSSSISDSVRTRKIADRRSFLGPISLLLLVFRASSLHNWI